MGKLWKFLDGKKRAIGAVAGVVLSWAATYDMAPEKYLVLAASLLSIWTGMAITMAKKGK